MQIESYRNGETEKINLLEGICKGFTVKGILYSTYSCKDFSDTLLLANCARRIISKIYQSSIESWFQLNYFSKYIYKGLKWHQYGECIQEHILCNPLCPRLAPPFLVLMIFCQSDNVSHILSALFPIDCELFGSKENDYFSCSLPYTERVH